MTRRLVGYAEDLSESTSTGSTVTKASVTISAVNGTTYMLVWSYQAGSDDTTSIARIRCMDSTGAASRGLNQFRARDTTDYAWAGNVGTWTAASTASRTFNIDFVRLSGTGTVKIKNARLLVLELTSADASAVTVGNQTTSSATFVDAQALTFTPASTGDYLFVASAAIANGSTEIELQTPGGTSVNTNTGVIPYGGVYQPWSVVWRENGLTAVSQTARIRWRSTSGTQNLQAAGLVAIRLDNVHGAQTTQDDGADGGTDTSYTATESLAATSLEADLRDTIVLAAATVTDGSTTESSFVEFRDAGAQVIEGVHEASGGLTTSAGLIGYKPTASSASITFDIRRKSEGANTTTIQFAAIALLELNGSFPRTLSGSVTVSPTIRKSVAKRLSAAIPVAATLVRIALRRVALITAMPMVTTMRRSIEKRLSGTVTFAASLRKRVDKGIAATCGMAGSLRKALDVRLSATLSASATMTRTIGKRLDAAVGLTASLAKIKASIVSMSASVSLSPSLIYGRLYQRTLSAGITVSAAMQRTIAKDLSVGLPVVARPLRWIAQQFAATRNDKPNWNQCPRCARKVRPTKMHQQMEYRGPRLVWTGLYVCASCLDDPQQQGVWPRKTGGDPKPVILARPRRD